jgi:hypothetical protein
MRKRLVIGAIAVVVIGVAAYLLSQPKVGNLEYHKREYLKANKVLLSPGSVSIRFAPGFVEDFFLDRHARSFTFHQEALIDAGFLTKVWFVVSNAHPVAIIRAMEENGLDSTFATLWVAYNRAVAGVVPVEAIERVSQAIREADVPETK